MRGVLIGGPENSNEVHVGVDQHTVRHIIATLDATYEHTPGPWRLVNTNDGPTIAGAELGYLATTRGRFALKPPDEEAANARLIAASPDLLGIIEEAICAWPEFDDPDEPVNGGDMVEWFGFWRRYAKEAVARAR